MPEAIQKQSELITPKFPFSGNTIFSVMNVLAAKYNAINLAQGFPDYPIDESLSTLVAESIKQGFNQYVPVQGLPSLRQAIARKLLKLQNITVDTDAEITITPGATYGIYTALTTILQPGDEVIVFEPAYDSYIPNIYLNGAVPVTVALNEGDFSVNWDKVKQSISPKTKAIVINNPHNPCGVVWSEEDLLQLEHIVAEHNLFVVSDEVYEHIIFDSRKHLSVLQFPELRKRSFAVYSFGKTLHATGWKIGYVIAAPDLTRAFRQNHQYIAFTVNSAMQQAIAWYIEDIEKIKAPTLELEQKRNLFLSELEGSRFTYKEPVAGSYFQLLDYSAISDLNDMDFAEWLTREHKVAAIPLSPFYKEGYEGKLLRFCFAKKDGTLKEVAAILKSI